MKPKTRIAQALILWLIISSCSCTSTMDSTKETSFTLLYPECSMNSTIRFLPLQPNYRSENLITVSFQNTSQSKIAYFPSKGVKIFFYDDKNLKWLDINNNMQYSTYPDPYVVVGPFSDISSYRSVVLSPDIVDKSIVEIRVAIIGYIYEGGVVTDNCVGAYIDLK